MRRRPGERDIRPVAKEEEEGKDKPLQVLADTNQAALLTFIAPLAYVRISPVHRMRAQITIADEFAVEEAVGAIRKDSPQTAKAYILLNTEGGTLSNAYQIARVLRKTFKEIITFVPHMALSGGTLLAIGGNCIKLGMFGRLGPLDPQIQYQQGWASATTFMKFFQRSADWYETALPEELPYTQRALTDKLDPILMEEWGGYVYEATQYTREILGLAGYEQDVALAIAARLVNGFSSHSEVIHADRARDLGLKIAKDDDLNEELAVLRSWLWRYLFEPSTTHIVRYVIPSPRGDANAKNKEPDQVQGIAERARGAKRKRT